MTSMADRLEDADRREIDSAIDVIFDADIPEERRRMALRETLATHYVQRYRAERRSVAWFLSVWAAITGTIIGFAVLVF